MVELSDFEKQFLDEREREIQRLIEIIKLDDDALLTLDHAPTVVILEMFLWARIRGLERSLLNAIVKWHTDISVELQK